LLTAEFNVGSGLVRIARCQTPGTRPPVTAAAPPAPGPVSFPPSPCCRARTRIPFSTGRAPTTGV